MLSAPPQAKTLVLAGHIAWEQGDYERSRTFSEEGLAMARRAAKWHPWARSEPI